MGTSRFLSVAVEAAKNAEMVIMKHYAHDIGYTRKSDLTPVTLADTEAEAVIIQTIKEAFPDHAFLSEESGSDEVESEYQWIIDPIDGTKNFTRHIPIFGTQIALLYRGEIIVGVSNAPALQDLMYAERGRGAFHIDKPTSVSSVADLSDAYLCFGGLKYFGTHAYADALLELTNHTFGYRGFGDFWSYHLLAQGKIDIMIEAETHIWDIAAVKIIVEEAGGMVTDLQGHEIKNHVTSIAATNGQLHDQVASRFVQ